MGRLDVIVGGDAGPGALGSCLDALARAGLVDTTVLVIGGADAGDADVLREWGGDARLLLAPPDADAVQRLDMALRAATAPLVAALDVSVSVLPGWADALRAALEDPGVGLAAPLVRCPEGRARDAGLALAESALVLPLHPGAPAAHPALARDREVAGVGVACWAVRRGDALAAGGLRRRYGHELAAADLCLRLARRGLRTVLRGATTVVAPPPPPRRPDLLDGEHQVFRQEWMGWEPDRDRRLAEDGVDDASDADCRWSGPLLAPGPAGERARAHLEALVASGRRPVVLESPRGPLDPAAAELCAPWMLAALNRAFVRVPAAELHLMGDAAPWPVEDPPPAGPVRRDATPAGAAPRARHGLGWWGPLLGRSGYAAAGRAVLEAAALAEVPIRGMSTDTPAPGIAPPHVPLPPQDFAPAAWVGHHPPVVGGVDAWEHVAMVFGTPVVGATCFEAAGVPEGWVEASRHVREVWVPTGFNARTFAQAGMDADRIHVVPYPVDPSMITGPRPPRAPGGPVTFLSVFEWTWRKGWDVLLRAWAEEFAADEPVRLVVLTYRGAGGSGEMDIGAHAVAYLQDLGHDPARVADIELRLDPVPHGGMPALYAGADALVLPSRGEGAGMPVFEAAAGGLPVIATAIGGHEELMDPDIAFPIAVEALVPAADELVRDNPIYEGMLLTEPGVASLRAQLRAVAEDPAGAWARAEGARRLAIDRFSVQTAARALRARADALLGTRAPARI